MNSSPDSPRSCSAYKQSPDSTVKPARARWVSSTGRPHTVHEYVCSVSVGDSSELIVVVLDPAIAADALPRSTALVDFERTLAISIASGAIHSRCSRPSAIQSSHSSEQYFDSHNVSHAAHGETNGLFSEYCGLSDRELALSEFIVVVLDPTIAVDALIRSTSLVNFEGALSPSSTIGAGHSRISRPSSACRHSSEQYSDSVNAPHPRAHSVTRPLVSLCAIPIPTISNH